MNFKNTEKVVRTATIGIIIYLLCFGIAMAFFPIRPFWNDEWRLLYNIKFRNVHQLWGTLDLLQQCPRCYLTLLKVIIAPFDYSYTAIRLPALIITTASIFFCFYLKKKIFPQSAVFSYLFILILISSQTFTDYIVQVKHYEMDIFLSLLALWQLITLLNICYQGIGNRYRYLLLCFSFLAAPFLSYVYPIAVAPIFPVILLASLSSVRNRQLKNKATLLLSVYLPLVIVSSSIVIFYFIDVKQLMADNRMYLSYWKMLGNKQHENPFIENFWNLFSLVGSGCLYEIIFGILGIAATVYAIYTLLATRKKAYTRQDHLKGYAVLLLLITLCLLLADKLMGGVARLTAYTVPSIAMLITFFFEDVKTKYGYAKPANFIAAVMFLGLFGNIASTCINRFTYPEYNNRINTYWNTSLALKEARRNKIPILITNGQYGDKIDEHAAVPGKIGFNMAPVGQIACENDFCAEVILKDNPEYKTWDPVPVYFMPDMKWAGEYIKQLPPQYTSAIACDGINIIRLTR